MAASGLRKLAGQVERLAASPDSSGSPVAEKPLWKWSTMDESLCQGVNQLAANQSNITLENIVSYRNTKCRKYEKN